MRSKTVHKHLEAHGPLSHKELVQQLSLPGSFISNCISDLRRMGLIEKIGPDRKAKYKAIGSIDSGPVKPKLLVPWPPINRGIHS